MRILVVDDEIALVQQLQTILKAERYLVDTASDGETALLKLTNSPPDLIILDIMLPKLDGLSVLRQIRENDQSIPILMLSARDLIEDKVAALDSGADDYLAKPFSPAELMARMRVLFRRRNNPKDNTLLISDLELDTKSRELRKAGRKISSPPGNSPSWNFCSTTKTGSFHVSALPNMCGAIPLTLSTCPTS